MFLCFSAIDLLAERADDAAITAAEDIPPRAIDGALARIGWGPDHTRGEALLAWVSDGGGRGAIIGSHRAVVVTRDGVLAFPYEAVSAVSVAPGMGNTSATVALGGEVVRWTSLESARVVSGLLSDLLLLQPPQRLPVAPRRPQDARTRMVALDARLEALLALSGGPQVQLLERLQYGGRGQSGGLWLSCLQPADLAAVLCGLFGPNPVREGAHTLRWSSGGLAGDLARHLAGQAVAAGMAAVIGVGIAPGSAPSIKSITATVRPLPGGCGFSLLADRGSGAAPLSVQDPARLAAVLHRLRQAEPRWLLRQLVGCPETRAEAVQAAAQARLPGVDLSPFFGDRARPAASAVRNPAFRPPERPAPVLPQRGGPRVGEVAAWDQITAGGGLIHLGVAAVNLVYPLVVFAGVAALGQAAEARAGLPGQPFAVAALLPLGLYPLAALEAAAGAAALWKKGAARPLVRGVCVVECLSACIGGLPSLGAALLVLLLDRQARRQQREAQSR